MSVAYDLSDTRAENPAIALEYFHTASLIFDDLPCMDNASHRRGAPCVHRAHDESSAILAALALINRGYALIWQAVDGCPASCQARALVYIERRLGVEGLLNGQSLDLHYSTLRHDRETAERIARGKTVSPIRLPLVLPAILGGASDAELRRLERIALYWGLSYQIVDDLKDVLQSAAEAVAIGIPGAVERLHRLIRLGDRTLRGLLSARPAIVFLERLRADLEEESARIVRNACALTCAEQS